MTTAVLAAPIFYNGVEDFLAEAILVVALALMAWAFVNALMQRAEAFPAIGTLSKSAWLAILGSLLLIGFMTIAFFDPRGVLQIFTWIGIGAAAYYLLETRRGIKDVSEGPW
jgi:hypothetical protein